MCVSSQEIKEEFPGAGSMILSDTTVLSLLFLLFCGSNSTDFQQLLFSSAPMTHTHTHVKMKMGSFQVGYPTKNPAFNITDLFGFIKSNFLIREMICDVCYMPDMHWSP